MGGARGEVELFDSNHCPGAVLLLFRLENGRVMLHTGAMYVYLYKLDPYIYQRIHRSDLFYLCVASPGRSRA